MDLLTEQQRQWKRAEDILVEGAAVMLPICMLLADHRWRLRLQLICRNFILLASVPCCLCQELCERG